jgi:hypothetical protein
MPQIFQQAQQLPRFGMAPNGFALGHDELTSVHGGTASSHGGNIAAVETPRSSKWPLVVLSAAAIAGVIAAIVLQLGPKNTANAANVEPSITQSAPVAAVAPTPTAAPAPVAPVVAPAAKQPEPPSIDLSVKPDPTVEAQPLAEAKPVVETKPADDEIPSVAAIVAADPPVEKTKVSAKAKKSKTGKRVALAATADDDDDEAPAPKKMAAAKAGILTVRAWPWGWVSIDGGKRIQAPQTLRLSPGKHSVKIFTDDQSKIRTYDIDESCVWIVNVDWDHDQMSEVCKAAK